MSAFEKVPYTRIPLLIRPDVRCLGQSRAEDRIGTPRRSAHLFLPIERATGTGFRRGGHRRTRVADAAAASEPEVDQGERSRLLGQSGDSGRDDPDVTRRPSQRMSVGRIRRTEPNVPPSRLRPHDAGPRNRRQRRKSSMYPMLCFSLVACSARRTSRNGDASSTDAGPPPSPYWIPSAAKGVPNGLLIQWVRLHAHAIR
jgi:hypothetical protein